MWAEILRFIGVALLAWVAFDLFAGHSWLWIDRKVVRADEPGIYWALILFWLSIALLCFVWSA